MKMIVLQQEIQVKKLFFKFTLEINTTEKQSEQEGEQTKIDNANFNKYILDENHKFSIKDYENLKPADQLKYDKRNFIEYMRDSLLNDHPLFSFFKKSLKNPIEIRVLLIFTSFNLNFATNALLFNDGYIDQRANADKSLRESFFYTAAQEAIKTILSLAFCTTIDSLLEFLFRISDSTTRDLNLAMMSKDIEKIKEEK